MIEFSKNIFSLLPCILAVYFASQHIEHMFREKSINRKYFYISGLTAEFIILVYGFYKIGMRYQNWSINILVFSIGIMWVFAVSALIYAWFDHGEVENKVSVAKLKDIAPAFLASGYLIYECLEKALLEFFPTLLS